MIIYQYTILSIIITNSLIILSIKTPLSLGIILIFQTLLICFSVNIIINIYWISYIIYLIILGGLLIIFIYICSVASNEIINPLKNILFIFVLFLIIFFIIIYSKNEIFVNIFYFNIETSLINENKIIVNKIYNKLTFNFSFILIIYLLIILPVINKLTNTSQGPFRQKI